MTNTIDSQGFMVHGLGNSELPTPVTDGIYLSLTTDALYDLRRIPGLEGLGMEAPASFCVFPLVLCSSSGDQVANPCFRVPRLAIHAKQPLLPRSRFHQFRNWMQVAALEYW